MKKSIFLTIAVLLLSIIVSPALASADAPIEPVAKIKIYVHADCPHCKRVERFVSKSGLEDKIEYIELKNNDANMAELQAIFAANNLPDSDRGWPFMVESEDPFAYKVGDAPIIQYLEETYRDEITTSTDANNSYDTTTTSDVLLLGVGVLFMGVLGYGIYALMGSKRK